MWSQRASLKPALLFPPHKTNVKYPGFSRERGPPVCRQWCGDSEMNARLQCVWLAPEARSHGAVGGHAAITTEGF